MSPNPNIENKNNKEENKFEIECVESVENKQLRFFNIMNKILKYAFSRTEEEVQESVDIFLENPTKDNFKNILRTR